MKAISIILLSLMSVSLQAQQIPTPNANELTRQKATQRKYLVQQIAALKVYLEYLKKGYDLVQKGLTTIGNIKDGTFSMDKDYFNSRKAVSAVVRKSPKVRYTLAYTQGVINAFQEFIPQCKADEYLTEEEKSYLASLHASVLEQCEETLDEVTLITTDHSLDMTDDDRLQRLDKVYAQARQRYTATGTLIASVRTVSTGRAHEHNEAQRLRQLHIEL